MDNRVNGCSQGDTDNSVTVIVRNNGDTEKLSCVTGTPIGDLVSGSNHPHPLIAARVNNEIVSLGTAVTVNCEVEFLDASDSDGWRVYRNSLCFLLACATHDLFPRARLRVEHSLGPGLYCSLDLSKARRDTTLPQALADISAKMREIVESNTPIERLTVSYTDAVSMLKNIGQQDKLNLLQHINPPKITLQRCNGFYDLAQGPLTACTATLQNFELIHHNPGFVLHIPQQEHPGTLDDFSPQPHLFGIYQEHKEWGRISGITTVGQLNQAIIEKRIGDYMQTCEALHEKKLGRIADQIAAEQGVKLVLIAGPSSAGKTTFAKRLTTHLRVNGRVPHMISTDNYFVGESRNPIGPDGKPDYEHVEAVDLELLNNNLKDLLNGREVELPRFNFVTKAPEFNGDSLKLNENDILIMEGIHALNPRLTECVERKEKFLIYVSALTQLGIDSHNRISTTDNRLMRRIVRDNTFRGHSAHDTLSMWSNVRAGEKHWIFPFQHLADATFNTALDYELAVLKPIVELQLTTINPDDPEYSEARRLQGFLGNFLEISDYAVPGTSILREYIGGSKLQY